MGFGLPSQMKPAVVARVGGGVWGYCDICTDASDPEFDFLKLHWLVAWDRATGVDYCQDCVNHALTADRILVKTGNLMNMRHPRRGKESSEFPPR